MTAPFDPFKFAIYWRKDDHLGQPWTPYESAISDITEKRKEELEKKKIIYGSLAPPTS